MAPQAAADNVPPVNIAPAPAAPAAKTEPWDDCSITKPKPKHAASLTLH